MLLSFYLYLSDSGIHFFLKILSLIILQQKMPFNASDYFLAAPNESHYEPPLKPGTYEATHPDSLYGTHQFTISADSQTLTITGSDGTPLTLLWHDHADGGLVASVPTGDGSDNGYYYDEAGSNNMNFAQDGSVNVGYNGTMPFPNGGDTTFSAVISSGNDGGGESGASGDPFITPMFE